MGYSARVQIFVLISNNFSPAAVVGAYSSLEMAQAASNAVEWEQDDENTWSGWDWVGHEEYDSPTFEVCLLTLDQPTRR